MIRSFEAVVFMVGVFAAGSKVMPCVELLTSSFLPGAVVPMPTFFTVSFRGKHLYINLPIDIIWKKGFS